MCIGLRWDNNDSSVLYQTFEEGWTLAAYYHSVEALEAMVSPRKEPVTVIMDMRKAPNAPIRMSRGRTVNESDALRNVKQVIIVNAGHFVPMVNCTVHMVSSMEDACAIAYNADARIPA